MAGSLDPLSLQPKPLAVLWEFVRRAKAVVTKEDCLPRSGEMEL